MMSIGSVVHDRWWPHRAGVVIRIGKVRVRVRWSDGEVQSYDRAHRKFLFSSGPTDASRGGS